MDEVEVQGDAQLNSRENHQSNDIIDGEDVADSIDFYADGFDIVEGDPNIETISLLGTKFIRNWIYFVINYSIILYFN